MFEHHHVMGGAALGGLYRPASTERVTVALETAWKGGVRAFDTAPHYGVGLSEERLGGFLVDKPRNEFVLSTKVGRLLVEDPTAVDGTDGFFGTPKRSRIRDYSAKGVRQSHAESLQRLDLDRIDVLLIHDPEDHMPAAVDEAAPELARMREEKTIRGFGVGTNYVDVAMQFVQRTSIDCVMIAGRYSLLDRRAERELLTACAEKGISVLVAGVFNSGLLADPWRRTTFDYTHAPAKLVESARHMADACQRHDVTLRAAALQFPLRHPAVSAVVSGAGSAETVTDVLTQQSLPIPDELWAELDTLTPDQADLT